MSLSAREEPAHATLRVDAKRVLDHYVATCKPPRAGNFEEDMIRARLKWEGVTAQVLCDALSGYAGDPWWNGTDGDNKLLLSTCLKDQAAITMGLRKFQSQKRPKAPPREARRNTLPATMAHVGANAGHEFMERLERETGGGVR